MTRYLGVDPGLSGAFAVYNSAGKCVDYACDMPTFFVNKKERLDHHALMTLVDGLNAEGGAVIERVGAMPGQGVASTFRFGEAYGVAQMALIASGFPIRYATPQVWKKAFGFPPGVKDKDLSRQIASRLLPDSAHWWPLKKHHGRADAALLAVWLSRQTT